MERVAIVGSRDGADLSRVEGFLTTLHLVYPDTILVSGGATGVDSCAEQFWLAHGGQVESYRPIATKYTKEADGKTRATSYGIEKWELGGASPRAFRLLEEPEFGNYASAAIYRDILIAERADRTVAFFRPGGSRGAGFTVEMTAGCYNKPVHVYEAQHG